MEKNIKKIFEDNNKKHLKNSNFIHFIHCFFNKEEYFFIRLIFGSYFYNKIDHNIILDEDIQNIIISCKFEKLFLVLKNVNTYYLNEILKIFCDENIKKFEIFRIYMNYMQHKQHINYIKYMNDMKYKQYVNYMHFMIDMQYMNSQKYLNFYWNIKIEIENNFFNSNYEILSAHIYCINFNARCFPNWSEKFINTISNLRVKETKFNQKFEEYRNYFDNKKGILQYLNDNQYLILKEFLYEIEENYKINNII